MAEISQSAANEKTHANRKTTCKLRKHLHQFDNACAVNTHNTKNKEACCKNRNALQIVTDQLGNVKGNRKVVNMARTYLSMFALKGFLYIISLNKLTKYTITVTVKGYVSWLTYFYNFPYKKITIAYGFTIKINKYIYYIKNKNGYYS